jgi:integrase
MTRLTDTAIAKAMKDAKATGKRVDLSDDGQKWLRLRTTPGGAASWALLCRDPNGRVRRFLIGSYPGLKLSAARDKARSLREKVRDGHDPVAEARARRAAREMEVAKRSGAMTLAGLLEQYETKGKGQQQKSWPASRTRLTSLFRSVMDVPLCDLKLGALQAVIDNHGSKNSAGWGARTLMPVLRWAAEPGRKHCSEELLKLSAPARPKARQRTLSDGQDGELGKVWRALSGRAGESHADCMRFILLTLMRRSEAEGVKWSDVDWQAETIKLAETKNGKPHTVALSTQALALLKARRAIEGGNGELVFPSERGTVLTNWQRPLKTIHRATGTKGWHLHDLRRTSSTVMGQMLIPPHIVESALNHTNLHSQIASVYNTARYFDEVRAAMQRLGDKLEGLLEAGQDEATGAKEPAA